MGLPYSREINAAFEQVTPLVAAGFQVLRTTKNISILLAIIQVLTVLFLAMILFVLVLLLYSVNPDLEVRASIFCYCCSDVCIFFSFDLVIWIYPVMSYLNYFQHKFRILSKRSSFFPSVHSQ